MRRGLFLFLLAGFTAACLWWLLDEPHQPRRLFRLIPREAGWVSSHYDIAGRWEELTGNPMVRSFLLSLGLQPADLAGWAHDPDTMRLIQGIASREAVWAYLPPPDPFGSEAWLFAAWIGGRSQRWRWWLAWYDGLPFSMVERYAGRTIWRLDEQEASSSPSLHFTLSEGMLIGALSDDPYPLRVALDTLDGRLPAARALYAREAHALPGKEAFEDDHIWLTTSVAWWSHILCRVHRVSDRHVGATIVAQGDFPAEIHPMTDDGDALQALLGDRPMAMISASIPSLLNAIRALPADDWSVPVIDLLRRLPPGNLHLALLGGDLSGRWRGIRLPGLVFLARIGDAQDSADLADDLLDTWNARYRWGLIRQRVRGENRQVFTLEATGAAPWMSGLAPEERPAYAVRDGWLLVAANLGTLRKLTAWQDAGPAPVSRGGWLEAWREPHPAAAVWVDLDRGQETARLALTAYSLKLLLEDPAGSRPLRQNLNQGRGWLDALVPMHSALLRLSRQDAAWRLEIRAGEKGAE